MVFPNPNALGVLIEIGQQPVGTTDQLFPPCWVARTPEQVVIPKPPLCDGDRIVLEADLSAIVEHGDTVGVIMSRVVGFFRERHIIFVELIGPQVAIEGGRLVPKRELALAGEQVSAEDSLVVAQSVGQGHSGDRIAQSSYATPQARFLIVTFDRNRGERQCICGVVPSWQKCIAIL